MFPKEEKKDQRLLRGGKENLETRTSFAIEGIEG